MSARRLTADDLTRACDFIYGRTGLVYGEAKHYYAERRLTARMGAVGTTEFRTYFDRLVTDPAEAEALVNAFTINETYFYREKHQLQSLSGSVLPILTTGKAPGEAIRIWSMPCSTGEEPYSIAIWLLENWPLVDAYNVDITGSDVDTEALEGARLGVYGARALSHMAADLKGRYFDRLDEGRWEIIQDLKESVRFTCANLIDSPSLSGMGRFDVVFCRNLLIYFDNQSRTAAIDNLYRMLSPGGFLFLGHTESLAKVTDRLIVTRLREGIAYRKPVDAP
ncbi:MAG TPA: protein-glutamate O-methyltransferase CheR [Caulobacteraceae bacterium]|jgi:chemotaxis protein methyltransferase CheR